MTTLRPSRADDGVALIDAGRAVDATHDFLSAEDRQAIDAEVASFLPQAPMTVAVDAQDRPLGFMLIDGTHMEALFIDRTCAALVSAGNCCSTRWPGIRS